MSELNAVIGALLKERKQTIAVAESSAGGLINAALVAVPGASVFYLGGGVIYTKDAFDCAKGADALAVITEWSEFRELDAQRLKKALATPTLVDLRNIWDPETMRSAGFTYTSIGRP